MKKIIFRFLFLGGLSFSSCFISTVFASEAVIVKDVFVFKVGGSVFGRNDLFGYYNASKLYNCMSKTSLVNTYFDNIFNEKKSAVFQHESLSISVKEKDYYSDYLPFAKILMYSKSFDLSLDKTQIIKKLNKSNCLKKESHLDLNEKELFEIASLDFFLKSRFLPQTPEYEVTSKDLIKAKSGVKNLINSIFKQIDQEVYW